LSAIDSSYITDLTIVNADISASAAIVDTKLATISTAGKVSDSALSATVTKLGSDIGLGGAEVSGTLALTNGGTGATTASGARTALGLGSVSLLSAIDSSYITDLTIVNADISASAAIVDTKLATISTAGKVSDSALSALVTKLGSDISLSGSEVSGTLPISKGGLGTTGLATKAILFSYGSSVGSDGSMLIWDYDYNRMGIGIATPNHTLDVFGNIGLTASYYINWGTTDGETGYGLRDNSGTIQYKNSGGAWSNFVTSSPDPLTGTAGQTITFGANGSQAATSILYIDSTNNKVGVGTTTPSSTLDVAGTLGGYGLALTAHSSSGSSGSTPAAPGEWADYSANSVAQSVNVPAGVLTFDDGNTVIPYYSDALAGYTLLVVDSAGTETNTGEVIGIGHSFIAKKVNKNTFVIAWLNPNNGQGYYRAYSSTGTALSTEIAFTAGNYNVSNYFDFTLSNSNGGIIFMFFNSNYYRTYYRVCDLTSCYVDQYSEPSIVAYAAISNIKSVTLSNGTPLFVYADANSNAMKYSLYYQGSLISNTIGSATSVYPTAVEALPNGKAIVTWNETNFSKYVILDCLSTPGQCSYDMSATTIETGASGHMVITVPLRLVGDEVILFTNDFDPSGTSDIHYTIYDSTLTTQKQVTTTISTGSNGFFLNNVSAGFATNTFAIVYGGYSDPPTNSILSYYYQIYSGGGVSSNNTYSAVGSAVEIHSFANPENASAIFADGSSIFAYPNYLDSTLYFNIYDSAGSLSSGSNVISSIYDGNVQAQKLSNNNVVIGYKSHPANAYGLYATVYDSAGALQVSEFPISSTGYDSNSYYYLDFKMSAMSNNMFFVASARNINGTLPPRGYSSYYVMEYSICDGVNASCTGMTYMPEYPETYGPISLTTFGSGDSEKIFIAYVDSNSAIGKYIIYDESMNTFSSPLSFAGVDTSAIRHSVQTLANGNIVLFYTLSTGAVYYTIFDINTSMWAEPQLINSISVIDSFLYSNILNDNSILLYYALAPYGFGYLPAFTIFDSTLSTTTQSNTFVYPAGISHFMSLNVNSVPSLDKFVFTYGKKNSLGIFSGAEFATFEAGVVSGGSTPSSSTTSTADLSFADTSSTIQWMLRMDTTSNTIHFLDAGGDDGVYLTQDSTSWTSNSDQRLKTNILDLNVLDRIDNYRAVSFNWIKNGNADVGAIAQELYKVFPEVVTVGRDIVGPNGEGAWGIQYSKLSALALEGVKELKQQMDVYNALLLGGGMNQFINDEAVSRSLVFSRNVAFTKHIALSQDSVGMALIQAGENGVRVVFREEYSTVPVITLTLASNAPVSKYYVDNVSTSSFDIFIEPMASQDTLINWHAFAQLSDEENIMVSSTANGTTSTDNGNSISSDNLSDLANNYLQIHNLTDADINDNDSSSAESTDVLTTNTNSTSTDNPSSPVVEDTPSVEVITEVVVPIIEDTIVSSTMN